MEVAPQKLMADISARTAPTILDVRSGWEYRRGHAPGAIHIPFWTIQRHLSRIPGSIHDPLVVYCGHGPRAWVAGALLRRRGFRHVMYLTGHMHGWRRAGLPEER